MGIGIYTLATFTLAVLVLGCAQQETSQTSNANPVNARNQVTTEQVVDAIADPNWVVVDTRASDAFNGWALEDIERGGHIPGAVDFSATWLDVDLEDRTQRLQQVLHTKGIDPADNIVLYSIRENDRQRVADFLMGLGYQKIHHFDLQQWLGVDGKLERYPQHHLLVPPSIVKRLIDGELPETFDDAAKIKFVEVSWGDETSSYSKGHIPGSFHVNTDHFEPPPKWYLGDSQVLSGFAADYGFQRDDTVIISSADVMASYRLCVVLLYMGVADARVLNGGLAAWKRAGYSVETEAHPPTKSGPFGAPIPQRPELVIETKLVQSRLSVQDEFALINTRTWAEFLGETSGYTYHQHKGRIPGASYGQGDFRGPDSMTPYRNVDQTMRNFDEIMSVWRQSGIDTEKHLCFMCGGGWRAAEVLMFARVAGKKDSSLYSDGWIGWSNDPQNPVETGPRK